MSLTELTFWGRHVMEPSDGCRLWAHDLTQTGYGRIRINTTCEVRLNTITCMAWHGPRPTGSMALHSCRNRHCWAGEHLRWGTAQENMDDRVTDGTDIRGEKAPWRKLNNEQVLAIRERFVEGTTMYRLAKDFGVSQQNIKNIVTRKIWTHI